MKAVLHRGPSQKRLGLRASLGALLFLGVGGACAQIAGIEDRNFDPGVNPVSLQCEEYCNLVGNTKDSVGVCPMNYSTRETCLGVCGRLEPGDPDEALKENSVACRLNQARAAERESGAERDSFCQAAGPGGNGACGSNCESFCMLSERNDVCGEINAQIPDCVEKCAAFGDSKRFNVGNAEEEFDHSGDTVQCRLVHVSNSSSLDAIQSFKETHCGHAEVHATSLCVDELLPETTCQSYCHVLEVACQGERKVYDSEEQCLATCPELELGDDPFDDFSDTVGCRKWHAHSALLGDNHCHHAGPTGDGHCGHDTDTEFAQCRPYCRLLEAACPTEFGGSFDDGDDCIAECDTSPASFGAAADHFYSVETAPESGDTLNCRTYFAVKAIEDKSNDVDPTANCASAFGASPCN